MSKVSGMSYRVSTPQEMVECYEQQLTQTSAWKLLTRRWLKKQIVKWSKV